MIDSIIMSQKIICWDLAYRNERRNKKKSHWFTPHILLQPTSAVVVAFLWLRRKY